MTLASLLGGQDDELLKGHSRIYVSLPEQLSSPAKLNVVEMEYQLLGTAMAPLEREYFIL